MSISYMQITFGVRLQNAFLVHCCLFAINAGKDHDMFVSLSVTIASNFHSEVYDLCLSDGVYMFQNTLKNKGQKQQEVSLKKTDDL